METIKVWRNPTEVTLDDNNNPVPGTPALWKTIDTAYCWPDNEADTIELGRDARVTGYKVVIRTPIPTGIIDTDLIEIKGTRYRIDGDVGPWLNLSGKFKGEEFAVKRGDG